MEAGERVDPQERMGFAQPEDTDMTTPTAHRNDPTRKTALVAGVLYLLTFVSSIPAVLLLAPVVGNPQYILGSGPGGLVRLGAFLDLVNCLTAIGTAVALYSVVKRQHEGFAIGFVASRLIEAAILVIGPVAMLTLVTLRETAAAGADPGALVATGRALVAARNWSFAIGTGIPALNAFFLGTILYRSGLVPRIIPTLGLIGVPTFGSFVVGYIFGVAEPGSAWHVIGVAPIFVWELALGLWMAIRGFNRSAPIVVAMMAEADPSVVGYGPSAPGSAAAAMAGTA
jgi:hypothetical protein